MAATGTAALGAEVKPVYPKKSPQKQVKKRKGKPSSKG